VPNEGKCPKIGRIRAMYREKEAPPQSSKDDGGAILIFIFL
jgi:hypothetical protein